MTASAVGVTLATDAGEQTAAEATAASAASAGSLAMGGGPAPARRPRRVRRRSLAKVSVTSISVFLGNALVRGR